MREIVVPDVDEAIEDEAEALPETHGISAAAVTALIATLRLRGSDMRGSGALIVRWCDDGEQIELEIEAWPSGGPSDATDAGMETCEALFDDPHEADAFADPAMLDEVDVDERPPRRACMSTTVASSRLHRRMRRR